MTIFDANSLQKAIEGELATVPAGHTRCLVGYYTIGGSWRVSYAQRVGDHWTFGATVERDAKLGNIAGGIYVKGSW